jgi:hypothetical protein
VKAKEEKEGTPRKKQRRQGCFYREQRGSNRFAIRVFDQR